MADLTYDVSVNTTQAENSLTRLQKTVGGMNDSFIRLKTTLASISLGAIISQSLQFADAISDLSDASEIAIGNIIGFQNAVMASGGSAEGAQKAILKLVNSIGEAADGSAGLQQAFRDVGVTIDDLRTLSNQDILSKTITGLDKITDSAKRSTLVTQLLGKEFRNVAAGQLGAAYAEATANSAQYADAIKKGADAQQNIDKTLTDFKIGLLEAIKPFTEFISNINIGIENFKKLAQALIAVGAALLAFTLIGKAIRILVVAWETIVIFGKAVWDLILFLKQLSTGWRALVGAVSDLGPLQGAWLVLKAIALQIWTSLLPAFTAIGSVFAPVMIALVAGWGWIQKSTQAGIDTLKEYLNLLPGVNFTIGGGAGRGNGQAEMDQRKKDADEMTKKEKALREVIDRQAEAKQKVALESKQYSDNLSISLSRQTEAIAFETNMINLSKLKNIISDDQVEIYKAQFDSQVQGLAKVRELEQQREKLSLQLKYAKDEEKAGITAQIGQLGLQIDKTKEYYTAHDERLAYHITQLQTARKLDADRLQNMENMKQAIEDQIARQQALAEILRGANEQKFAAKDAVSANQLVGLSSIQKQIVDIQESARKAAEEAAKAFAEKFGEINNAADVEKFADGLDKIATAYKGVADAQIGVANANYETSRSFSTGWADAFAKYAEDAQNSAQHAQTYFDAFTKGFEDAIVSLVTGGKFSFKDFANSIIADFARIEARKALTNFMGGKDASGGSVIGSLFSWGKSLFGFANGGMMQAGIPAIVGERGPELFMPTTAGRINSNAQSFGRNEPTVVHTNVNYSIQAVDASSFRSLVARDPNFIYAVTEQGRRNQPNRRSA